MNAAGEAVEDATHGVDYAPEREDDEAAHGHDAVEFGARVVGLQHGQVEDAQNRYAVDGEMRGGEEEADDGGDDDGDEAGGLLAEGHDGVGDAEGVREEGDGDDEVEAAPDLGEGGLLLFKILVHLYIGTDHGVSLRVSRAR